MYNENSYHQKEYMVDHDRVHNMVTYTFLETTSTIIDEVGNVEEPNFDAKRFYEMLDAVNHLLYTSFRKCLSK